MKRNNTLVDLKLRKFDDNDVDVLLNNMFDAYGDYPSCQMGGVVFGTHTPNAILMASRVNDEYLLAWNINGTESHYVAKSGGRGGDYLDLASALEQLAAELEMQKPRKPDKEIVAAAKSCTAMIAKAVEKRFSSRSLARIQVRTKPGGSKELLEDYMRRKNITVAAKALLHAVEESNRLEPVVKALQKTNDELQIENRALKNLVDDIRRDLDTLHHAQARLGDARTKPIDELLLSRMHQGDAIRKSR